MDEENNIKENNIEVRFKDFAIYNVDFDYMKHLWKDVDSQVYFCDYVKYKGKPYLGIMVGIGSYNYFIPFTSAKAKQLKWKGDGYDHFLIYEFISKKKLTPNDVYYLLDDKKTAKHFLAVLDIKKMIPVPKGCYSKVDLKGMSYQNYRVLVRKEYEFCRKIQNKILKQVKEVYETQKSTGIVRWLYCNFTVLEEACDSFTHTDSPSEDS